MPQFFIKNFSLKKTRERFLRTLFRTANQRDPSWSELIALTEKLEGVDDIPAVLEIAKQAASAENNQGANGPKALLRGRKNLCVLILSTFPFEVPRHGGQHRLWNIRKAYQAAGCTVSVAGVLGSDGYPPTENFQPFPGHTAMQNLLPNTFLMEDWCLGQLFEHNDEFFARLASHIPKAADIIHVEHPWLFGFVERLRIARGWNETAIIYGSANIEHELKYEILQAHFNHDHAHYCSARVRDTELRAAQKASFVCYVSEAERVWLEQTAQRDAATLISAPNGASLAVASEEGIRQVNHLTGHRKFALFCASGHPPNVTGFWHYFQRGFGCLSPDERLVIAGGAGTSIASDIRAKSSACFSSRCVIAGEVDQETLYALVATAHTIVLPITHGSGTNLKTAEALISGHHVVTTTTALRGFEEYAESDGVYVADKVEGFLHALRTSMQRAPLSPGDSAQMPRTGILWEYGLRNLITFINSNATNSSDLV